MDGIPFRDARVRISHWIEEGASVLGVLPGLFDEHERVRANLEAAEAEIARLHRELDRARQETEGLKAENNGLRRERDEVAEMIAEAVNKLMNEALGRLRAPVPSGAR
jgi:septal ring factor EnvC (AmiA/AmiB activator)